MHRIRVLARRAGTALVMVVATSAVVSPVAAAEDTTRLPSRVVLLTDHSTPVKTWAPLEVRVRIETADGTPLAGRSLRIWDDSYERWRCCGPPPLRTTDAQGEVATVLHLDGNSANSVRVAAYWHGDDVYAPAIVEWYQPMVGYTTTLAVTHASQRVSGQALPVTVSVRRTDPATTTGCIDGAVVRLELAGPTTLTSTAVVDHDPGTGACEATVEFPPEITPGAYTLTATTGHDGWRRTDEPASYTATVRIDWQHVFGDAGNQGSVYLNIATREYRVVLADGRDSGIRFAGTGLSRTGVSGTVTLWRIDLSHQENGDSASGAFYSTGAFSAYGVLAGREWRLQR